MNVVAPIPRGLSLTTASLLLLVCVMAQLSHADHVVAALELTVPDHHDGGHLHSVSRAHSESGGGQHGLHCHEGIATCSDLPLAAGPGQLLVGDELLQTALMSALELDVLADHAALKDAMVLPPLPPPRAVL